MSSLSGIDRIQAMQRLIVDKLGTDNQVTQIMTASLKTLMQDVQNASAVRLAEAVGIAKILSQPTAKNCHHCGMGVGLDVSKLDVLKLRSEFCGVLREGRMNLTKPGVLKHLIVVNQERAKLEAFPQSKL